MALKTKTRRQKEKGDTVARALNIQLSGFAVIRLFETTTRSLMTEYQQSINRHLFIQPFTTTQRKCFTIKLRE